MNPIAYIKKQYWQLLDDSWLGRIIPFGIGLLVATLALQTILHFPLSEPINFGAWCMYFFACLYKYRDLKNEKKKQESKPKPPPEDFYV